ncbi:MAG TPA: hypothetical protein VIK16_00620, partial [Candidatus Limnocylindrales bacterium]
MGELTEGRYRCRMAPGSPAQTRTTALLRRAALVAPLLVSLAMFPGAAWAADPHNLDVIPAPLVSQSGGPARPAVSPPGLGTAQ